VARNRKRAKERRAKRTDGGYGGRRVAAAGGAEPAPNPIEHATPDVELADAQLAVGRAEPVNEAEDDLELEDELEPDEAVAPPGGGGRRRSPPAGDGPGDPVRPSGGELAMPAPSGTVAPRVGLMARLMGFLQGSWRELQRVQWPDRRQVAQATGVVIGFVIVAGVFLGVADLAFSHLMDYILK
jgi:preprotein translocase SecE subunit